MVRLQLVLCPDPLTHKLDKICNIACHVSATKYVITIHRTRVKAKHTTHESVKTLHQWLVATFLFPFQISVSSFNSSFHLITISIFPLHGYWVFAYENFRGSCCWFQLSRNADSIHSIKFSLTSVSESGRFVADKWFTYVAFNGHSIYLTPLIAMCQVNEASHTLDKLPLSQSNVNSVVHTYVSPIQVGVGVGTSLIWAVYQTLYLVWLGKTKVTQHILHIANECGRCDI